MLRIFQKGFNYSEDGEGNRLVYHLSGCQMTCPWCANPEGMSGEGGESVSEEAVTREILSARPLYFDGGGVTFTGGECTLQAESLLCVIEAVKKQGVSVAIESNTSSPAFLRVAEACDILILDYKSPDAEKLRRVTGGDLPRIENNIRTVIANKCLHLRIPVIHGFNDSDEDLDGFLAFLTSLPADRFDLELLPYHEYGKEKWEKLGKAYTVEDGFVDKAQLRAWEARFAERGITVIHT